MLRSLAIKEHSLGPEHPQIAVSLYQLARLYQGQDKYEQARQCYQRTLAIDKQTYGLDDSEVATDLEAYAALLFAMERNEEAETLLTRALTIRALSPSDAPPNVAEA